MFVSEIQFASRRVTVGVSVTGSFSRTRFWSVISLATNWMAMAIFLGKGRCTSGTIKNSRISLLSFIVMRAMQWSSLLRISPSSPSWKPLLNSIPYLLQGLPRAFRETGRFDAETMRGKDEAIRKYAAAVTAP